MGARFVSSAPPGLALVLTLTHGSRPLGELGAGCGLHSFAVSRLAFRAREDACSRDPRSFGKQAPVEFPAAEQALGAGVAGMRKKLLHVVGIIYVDGDAGQLQHDAGFAGGTSGGEMGLEAVISETQGEQIRGPAEGGVGSASVGSGREH